MIYSCHNCPDRAEGCHATCEIYRAEKAKHEQEKAQADKIKAERTEINNYTYEKVMKAVFSRERRRWR